MGSLHHGTFVLIGDGERAKLFRNKGDEVYPDLEIVDLMEHANPADREQSRDRPGRYRDANRATGGPQKSAFEETDFHQLEKGRFAKDVADALYQAAHRNQFEKLIVVAPPHVLGDLRKDFHKEVRDRIVAEHPKDLTGHPTEALEAFLKEA